MKNNNFSVLPFYPAVDYQNARKWWVYGRIYPLYTPLGQLLPFQITRPVVYKGNIIDGEIEENGYMSIDGDSVQTQTIDSLKVNVSSRQGQTINLYNIPAPFTEPNQNPCALIVILDEFNAVVDTFNPIPENSGVYSGTYTIPGDAEWMYIIHHNADVNTNTLPLITDAANVPVKPLYAYLYKSDGGYLHGVSNLISNIRVKEYGTFTVLVYDSTDPISNLTETDGQYFVRINDYSGVYYSDVFTWITDLSPYLKLSWWDDEDFIMSQGLICYSEPGFKNVLYLQAEIAKPEYTYEEDGDQRDGIFYPTKQISSKKYRFNFLAPEYLLDVLRFVRLSDYVEIENAGITYNVDSFLITPKWEKEGDIAGVAAEFETDTIAKKIGIGYIKSL